MTVPARALPFSVRELPAANVTTLTRLEDRGKLLVEALQCLADGDLAACAVSLAMFDAGVGASGTSYPKGASAYALNQAAARILTPAR